MFDWLTHQIRYTGQHIALGALATFFSTAPCLSEVTALWMGHSRPKPEEVTVSWTTDQPEPTRLVYQMEGEAEKEVYDRQAKTFHRVSIPLSLPRQRCCFLAYSGGSSREAVFPGYPQEELRLAVVANWQSMPNLEAILKDRPHLLLTAGDHVESIHSVCGPGKPACTEPFLRLIRRYPELFTRVPILPVLGNHDREIRPRGTHTPTEPVYDIDAEAFRTVFALPDKGWIWHFDLPHVGLRLIGLDLNHIGDQGTTWQSCHDFHPNSEQFRWYEKMTAENALPFLVTLHNERHASMRGQFGGQWERLFRRNTAVISGFGHFAELALKDGVAYFNTSLQGRGDRYPDPASAFLASEDNYLLMTVRPGRPSLEIQLKTLAGDVLYTWEKKLDSH